MPKICDSSTRRKTVKQLRARAVEERDKAVGKKRKREKGSDKTAADRKKGAVVRWLTFNRPG